MTNNNGEGQTRTKVAILTQDATAEKYRKWVAIAWAGSAVALVLAVTWVVILLTTRYSASTDAVATLTESNAKILEQNNRLQLQLEELEEDRALQTESQACYNLYTANVTEASAAFQSAALGDMLPTVLVLVVQDSPEYTGERREMQEGIDAILNVSELNERYKNAIEARSEWVNEGRPLPCPIDQ